MIGPLRIRLAVHFISLGDLYWVIAHRGRSAARARLVLSGVLRSQSLLENTHNIKILLVEKNSLSFKILIDNFFLLLYRLRPSVSLLK